MQKLAKQTLSTPITLCTIGCLSLPNITYETRNPSSSVIRKIYQVLLAHGLTIRLTYEEQ